MGRGQLLLGVRVGAVPAREEHLQVGAVAPGQLIALAGSTGYATGPHIHFALWAWDQSLYQPVPLGPLGDFPRGLRIPGAQRQDCARYHP